MSKEKDPETNRLSNNVSMNGGKIKFEMKLYHKPSAKEIASARPCRLFIVFTFVLFLVGFLIASIALLAITEKCNKRDKSPVPSKMQYQVNVHSFLVSDNDTRGDIKGLTSKLSYIKSLGVDSILLNDVISNFDFTLLAEIGTSEDLQTFVTRAKEIGLSVFLQMNVFIVSRFGDLFRECTNNISYCDWFVRREKNKTNDWVTPSGNSAWYALDVAPHYMYYSYYGEQFRTLNLRNENVVRMIKDKMSWWLEFGVKGFVFPDVSRLTVDDRDNITEQLDQDHVSSHLVLSQFYEFLDKTGAELWVIPGTSLGLTLGYLGTGNRAESHVVITDSMATTKTIDVNVLNHTISTLSGPNGSKDQIGWMVDGPSYQRIRSRFSNQKQAELVSLFLLTLPNQVLPYYGDERVIRSNKNGGNTSRVIFNKIAGGVVRDDSNNSEMSMINGFADLAKLRSVNGIFTGTPKTVYVQDGVLVLLYHQRNSEPASLVAVNFNDKESVIRNLKECGRYGGEVIFPVNSLGVTLNCAEIKLPSYSLVVAKMK